MAASNFTSNNYLSQNFVVSAGSVLFRSEPNAAKLQGHNWQICLIYYSKKDEWLLPKGRKDCGETIEAAAVRETFEETGYACKLLPCTIPTRAPPPGTGGPDVVLSINNATEPIAVTVRQLGDKGSKLIFWYICKVLDPGAEKIEGTQMESENFESHFLDAEEAIQRLTFEADREIGRAAYAIVKEES